MFKQETIKIRTANGIKLYTKIPMDTETFGKPRINWNKPPDGWLLCDGKYVNGQYVETIYPVSNKMIKLIWNKIIRPLPKGMYFYTTDIARQIIDNIPFEKINKYIDSGNTIASVKSQWRRTKGFTNKYNDFEYGTLMGNRASNFNLVYFPLKTMHSLGLIHYRKSPTLCRIKFAKFRVK